MCSIIGYIGSDKAAPVIVQGLKRMEYRGYDSVGVATFSDDQILIKKGIGKVDQVNSTSKLDTLSGSIGIGHTRWATHGRVTSANAHPHPSTSSKIAIVHNGIIDNFAELKMDLQKKGFIFKSETDSEVIANLLQYEFDKTKDIKKSMLQTVAQLIGDYAFVAVFNDGMLAAARFHEPLIVGIGNEGYFVSSDVLGFVEHTDQVIYPDNREFVIINTHGIQMFDFDGNPVKHQITKISKEFADSYKGEYANYTIKEISEQPRTILKAGHNTKIELDLISDLIKQTKNLYITGSGTSYNAALVAKYIFSKYAKLKIEPLIASEVPYTSNFFDNQSMLIALSQSGESADVLEAVKIA